MKKYILKSMMVSMLCILAASCVKDDEMAEYGQQKNSEKVFVQFTIELDEPTASSRTTWENYIPDNTSSNSNADFLLAENYINPVKVQVLLYDLNGNFISNMKDVTVNSLENNSVTPETENPQIYALTGSFEAPSDEMSQLNFKMMVFANCPTITKPEDYYKLTYNYNEWNLEKGIPMWGIATYKNVNLIENTSFSNPLTLQTPIYMLRSMAKIEVSLNKKDGTDDTYNLNSAEINKIMNTGMAVPSMMDTNNQPFSIATLNATNELGVNTVFKPATSGGTISGTLTGSNNVVCIYTPEYDNTNNDLNITLNLTRKNNGNPVYQKGTTPYSFKHGNYSQGGYATTLNIVRNHYYKYTVSIVNKLDIQVSVCPYGSYVLNPEFGL